MEEADELMNVIHRIELINMTEDDNKALANATICHLCENPMTDGDIVRKYCQTGKSLEAAHNVYTVNYKMHNHISVCHYPIHGSAKYNYKDLSRIATINERYTSLSLQRLRFVDSIQFSIDLWRRSLRICTRTEVDFSCSDIISTNIFICSYIRKYISIQYVHSFDRFNETCLPAREYFDKLIMESPIWEADYVHAKYLWVAFNMR